MLLEKNISEKIYGQSFPLNFMVNTWWMQTILSTPNKFWTSKILALDLNRIPDINVSKEQMQDDLENAKHLYVIARDWREYMIDQKELIETGTHQ